MTLDATAELAVVVVACGAVGGLLAGRRRLQLAEIDGWAVVAGAAAFGTVIAPIVLSGSPSFAGYSVLGDTAAHFVLADWIGSHGTQLGDLPPSSFRETLEGYLGAGYPLGGHAALEVVTQLAFLDVAWALQPFLALSIGCLALTLYTLLSGVVGRGWRRAAIAAIAAQPALVYAYAMQGSIKEITTLWLVPLCVALLVVAGYGQRAKEPARSSVARFVVPLTVGCAAAIASIGAGAVVWLGPLLLVGLVRLAIESDWEIGRIVASVAAFAGVLLVLSVPTLIDLQDYVNVTGQVVTTDAEFGNLLRPLRVGQVVGIWLSGDYRLPLARSAGIDAREITIALVFLAAGAAAVAVVWLLRRRALAPLALRGRIAAGVAGITQQGSPWADAKALAITAPAVLLIVLPGAGRSRSPGPQNPRVAAWARARRRRSRVQHDDLPRRQPVTARSIRGARGDRRPARGRRPHSVHGVRGVRQVFPSGRSTGRRIRGVHRARALAVRPHGARPEFAREANLGRLRPGDVDRFSALVLLVTLVGPRPSLDYDLTWRGRYYDVWTRRGEGRAHSMAVALGGHEALPIVMPSNGSPLVPPRRRR